MAEQKNRSETETRLSILENDIERALEQQARILLTENRIFSTLIGALVVFFTTFIGFQVYNTVETREALQRNETDLGEFIEDAERRISGAIGNITEAKVSTTGVSDSPDVVTTFGAHLVRDSRTREPEIIFRIVVGLQHDANTSDQLVGIQYRFGDDFFRNLERVLTEDEIRTQRLLDKFLRYQALDNALVPPDIFFPVTLVADFAVNDCLEAAEFLGTLTEKSMLGTFFVRPVFKSLRTQDEFRRLDLFATVITNRACP